MGKKIFTDHASERIAQRKIDISRIHETIDSADHTSDVSIDLPSRRIVKKRFEKTFADGVTIIVICEVLPEQKYKIITPWKKKE